MCLLPSSPTSFSSSQPLINAPRPENPDLTPPLLLFLSPTQELIPLILCTACLHPEPKERDQLLHILFNLIKRPDDEQRCAGFIFSPNASDEPVSCADILLRCVSQRQMILTGCVAFARHVGPTRVEAELLPQCWEQVRRSTLQVASVRWPRLSRVLCSGMTTSWSTPASSTSFLFFIF